MDRDLYDLHARVEDEHWWFVARRAILTRIVRDLHDPAPDALLLDIGCGTGGNAGALAGDYRCVGVDVSEAAVALARARFPGTDFRTGSLPEAAADVRGRVRVALLADVLEHVEDDRGLLRSALDTLDPAGHVVISVPADPSLWSSHDERFGHYRRYTRETLESLVRAAGGEVVMLSPFNARLYPIVRAVRAVTRRLRRGASANGTDVALPPRIANAALRCIFAGEARRLGDVLAGRRPPYARGVSLIAVVKARASSR